MIQCLEMPPQSAVEIWPDLKPYVAAAVAHDIANTVSVEGIFEQVKSGYARVLLCFDSAGKILSASVVQIFKDRAEELVLHVLCTAGQDSDQWLHLLFAKCNEMAAAQECSGITMTGRPGWARELRKFGFKTEIVTMRAPVMAVEQKREAMQ